MKKLFLLSIAALALTLAFLAAPLNALTVQETAQNYANAGESASVVDFTVGGTKYYMVKISGAESVVLKEENGAFNAIANETELLTLANEYLQQQFDALGFPSRSAAIVASYGVYRAESGLCVEAIKKLIRMSRSTPPYMYITINAGRDFPREYAALKNLNAALPDFEKAANATSNAVDSVEAAVAERNADTAVRTFNEINSNALAFKTDYLNISSSVTDIKTTFPNAFLMQVDLKSHCALDANQTAAVDAVISQSSLGAIKSVAELAKHIAETTASRGPTAKKRMTIAQEASRISEISGRIDNVTRAYSEDSRAAGATEANLTILWKQYGELNALHAQANNASTNGSDAAAVAFDRKASETEEKLSFFEATRKDYAESLIALNNATIEVNKIAVKYGSGDDRVASLQKDLRAVQLASKSQNDLLRDAMTTGAAFQAVTANATALSARAATLAPKENQLDFVLVGGVIILIGAGVGVFYYLRKKKEGGETKPVTQEIVGSGPRTFT